MRAFLARRGPPAAEVLAFLRRENLFRLMGVIVVLVLTGAAGLTYFEKIGRFTTRSGGPSSP